MLQVGDRAPDFVLPDAGGTPARFYGRVGGRPTVVVLPGSAASPAAIAELCAAVSRPGDVDTCWIAILPAHGPEGVQGWVDSDGAVASRFGAGAETDVVVVLDANLRVTGVVSGQLSSGDVSAARVLELLGGARLAGPAVSVTSQAPVLMVPRVVDDALCAELVDRCRAESVQTGVEKSVAGGRQDAVDHVLKRRRDLTVTEPAELARLSASVGRRLMPEVERAFAFRATRFEGFKIACYDENSGGFFAPHRDNLTVATAHRVFGLSINLNEGYDGGELAFPEFGAATYRAPAGGAMVFSCALLHAVQPVVRGERYVLLSFLYADPAGSGRSGK